MAGPLIPIIMIGARIVKAVPRQKAIELIKAGKAKWAKHVARDIDEGITKIAGKGKGAPKMPPLSSTARKKAATTAAKKKATTTTAAKARLSKATTKSQTKTTGTSTAQARLRKATGATTAGAAPKLPIGKGPKGALPTGASTSKLSFARRPGRRKSKTGLKEVGLAAGIASGVGYFAGTGKTKSVTVKAGDTLSQIAQDNNTTVAAIKKANPSITNIHRITPGQTIKVPKVKDRKSVYQGMTTAELQQPKKTTTTASKIKYGPGGYGASKSGGIVKRKSGGTVKKYAEGKMIGSKRLPRSIPVRPKGIGAALKGWGKTGSS